MMQFILGIQAKYAAYFNANAGAYNEFAPLYGWVAAASLAVLLVTLIFVFFRREQARVFAGMLGQHVLVMGIPWVMTPLAELIQSGL
ncbi:MAG TPA: hypothetical protein ENJ56_04480 [Anaerolineae bacterium]|nr:hypothetical protein [Anaerolineae bacterium]